ncbi:MAG: response regulator [Phycisphaerae bacterium]
MATANDKTSILIVGCVDDHGKRLIERLEREPGFEVIGACGTYCAALHQVLRRRPDLVLMDTNTPRSDPFQTAAVIRAISHRTRLLFCCDRPTDRRIEAVLTMKAHGLVCKTRPFAEVLAAIREVAAGGVYFRPSIADRLVIAADGIRLGTNDPTAEREEDVDRS